MLSEEEKSDIIERATQKLKRSLPSWWKDKPCVRNCYYFDGYDVCLNKKNFGAVGDDSIEMCKKLDLYFDKTTTDLC